LVALQKLSKKTHFGVVFAVPTSNYNPE